MVLHMGFTSWYLLYLAFAVWAALTIAVLLIMEVCWHGELGWAMVLFVA